MRIIKFRGLKIRVENEAGSVRSGVDHDGQKWSVKMPYAYGEILGTEGVDGDPVDVFIGPNPSAAFVQVIHQLNKQTGEFDEDKCFLGFNDAMDAKAAYYKAYSNADLFYGSTESIPFDTFKKRIASDSTMIHGAWDGISVTVGDPVTVDGLRGRGVVVEDDGSDVVIRYRNGEHFKRKKYNVHNMGDNMYRSRYQTVQAGGPGSGRRKGDGKEVWNCNNCGMGMYEKDIKRDKSNATSCKECGHPRGETQEDRDRALYKKYRLDAGEENVEMERGPITVPHGTNKRIQKVGTQFCVISDGVDKNFGCYPSREQAEAVMAGKSFIEPDIPAGMYAGDTMYDTTNSNQRGSVKPNRSLNAPNAHGPQTGGGAKPFKPPVIKPIKNRTLPISRVPKAPKSPKVLESFGDLGEPMAGSMGHAHIEPEFWFHPPSLKNPDHVPVDDPGEKDNKYLDVTKRKEAHTDRMKRLKRSAPGGLPPYIPAQTTGLSMSQSTFAPTIAGAELKKEKNLIDIIPRNTSLRVPHQVAYTSGVKAGRTRDKRMRVSFANQGRL